jgi:TPP-dependent pyruvate/acetoin dehydrogenase alpha subunit
LRGEDTVVVAFFGDGATGQGVFHESLNYSALAQLPVVWLCENNRYAAETPVDEAVPAGEVAPIARGYGMPCGVVDGSDVLAVFHATTTAVARARSGEGPTFLECRTHRWGVHAQKGVPQNDKRPVEYFRQAHEHDPVVAFERWLVESEHLRFSDATAIRNSVEEQLRKALAFAESSPPPDKSEAYAHVFA